MHRTFPASRALALVVGALALVATTFTGTAGATAPADDGRIHQTLPIDADSFTKGGCGPISEGTAWHFVLNHVDGAGSILTATLEGGSTATAVGTQSGDGATHFYVGTADGAVLTGASVDIARGQLQLSHVCDAPDVDDTDETDPALCPDGKTEVTDETDEDGDGVADMCEPGAVEDTTVEIECVDDDVVVTVTGQDLSNITFYDAEDGVRGGQDTVFEYSQKGDAPLPTPTVNEDGSEEFVVSIPEGAVRVSAKAALVEEYSDLDCTAGAVVDEDDDETVTCPFGTTQPADGVLMDADEDGVAENCTSVLDQEVVNESPAEGPTVPGDDDTPAQPEVDVEGDEVVPATPATPTVQPAVPATPTVLDQTPAVMGDVVTRSGQLPRTGADSTGALVPLGLALLAVGFALQRGGQRVAQAR